MVRGVLAAAAAALFLAGAGRCQRPAPGSADPDHPAAGRAGQHRRPQERRRHVLRQRCLPDEPAAVGGPRGRVDQRRGPRVARPSVVFDIDETALSNWEAIKANDFGRFVRRTLQRTSARAVRVSGVGPARPVDGHPADDGHLHHRQGPRRDDLLHHRPPRVRDAPRPNAICRPSATPATSN